MGSKAEKRIRIIRVQCIGSDGDWKADRAKLAEIARQIQQVLNDYAAHWLQSHYNQGNHLAVRAWMDADRNWVKAPKKERQPEKRALCPVHPLNATMAKELYAAMRKDHPSLGTKVVGLATQKFSKALTGSKAAKSAYPAWMVMLAGGGEFRQFNRPQPIPFYTANSRLRVPPEDCHPWKLEVRFEQDPAKPKKLTPITLRLKTGGRNLHSIRGALLKIASGEWKFCGSQLSLRDGQWYAMLAYQMPAPETPAVDAEKTAVLTPGRYWPLLLRSNGKTRWRWWSDRHIRRVRLAVCGQRAGRNHAYRIASSAGKGHGRNKAMASLQKLSRRWRDFVKTTNEQISARVLSELKADGIGRLVVIQG